METKRQSSINRDNQKNTENDWMRNHCDRRYSESDIPGVSTGFKSVSFRDDFLFCSMVEEVGKCFLSLYSLQPQSSTSFLLIAVVKIGSSFAIASLSLSLFCLHSVCRCAGVAKGTLEDPHPIMTTNCSLQFFSVTLARFSDQNWNCQNQC